MYKCKICGEYFTEYGAYGKDGDKCYCEDCIIEAMANDYDLFKRFLKSNELEKDFYIGFVFDSCKEHISNELVYLAKKDFASDMICSPTKEKCQSIITDYIYENDCNVFLDEAAKEIEAERLLSNEGDKNG